MPDTSSRSSWRRGLLGSAIAVWLVALACGDNGSGNVPTGDSGTGDGDPGDGDPGDGDPGDGDPGDGDPGDGDGDPGDGDGDPFTCGDGKLDPNEMCDGTPNCSPSCVYAHEKLDCSPITQVGCQAGDRCAIDPLVAGGSLNCVGNLGNAPTDAGIDDPCIEDHSCIDHNAVCHARPECSQQYCCTATCYFGETDEAFGGCPPNYTCHPVLEVFPATDWPEGIELLGICLL